MMKVYREVSARDFEFWSGAKSTVEYLTEDEIDEIFDYLEECNPDGLDETEVNDFFWFEDDTIAEWLGWPDFETLMEARSDGNWFDSYAEYEEFLAEQEEEEEVEDEDEEEEYKWIEEAVGQKIAWSPTFIGHIDGRKAYIITLDDDFEEQAYWIDFEKKEIERVAE